MRNRLSPTRLRKRSPRLGIEGLEDRVVPAAILNITNAPTGLFPQFDLVDPNPNVGGLFGTQVLYLPSGNIVVTDPLDNAGGANAGAVYLFNGTTGALISTITGSQVNDKVGLGVPALFGEKAPDSGVTVLSNGNFVINSPFWNDKNGKPVGAVTWGSGTTGLSGVVSASNSLVGSTEADSLSKQLIGGFGLFLYHPSNAVTALSNGNYVVGTPSWDDGMVVDAGASTWGDGTKGISGVISATNSLVGGTRNTPLANGNYVVASDKGATWADGSKGITGAITTANSLIQPGFGMVTVTALTNGNYVVLGSQAVTWGDGSKGIRGDVTATNSLVGSKADDSVGNGGVTTLTNGNYVVNSPFWDNGTVVDAGAVTWGDGTKGISGAITAANSLIGSKAEDLGAAIALTNGNYVVSSPKWDDGTVVDVGAVTWGNGTTGISGAISAKNSLVGSQANDSVSFNGVTALTNGNYVVNSRYWHNGAIVDAGAATWGDGTKGISGVVSAANSLVGTQTNDGVGNSGATALTNGNYVVVSFNWNNGAFFNAGAATWGDGTKGIIGAVTTANSLVGTQLTDLVGNFGVTALANGNYVVRSQAWDNGPVVDVSAYTWGDGTKGISGAVSTTNSLFGTESNNRSSRTSSVFALPNGNYVISDPDHNEGALGNAGAITLGNGTTGRTLDGINVITPQNSLIGSVANTRLQYLSSSPDGKLLGISSQGPFVITDANLLTFNRSGSKTIDVSPNLFSLSLNSGKDVLSQATATITVTAPIVVDNPNGNGGALTLESKGALNLNANITTDNGNLTLLGTTITPAAGVIVNTGTGTLNLPTGNLVLNQTLTVNGGVNLSGVSLTAQLPVPTIPGQSYTLIDKQIAGAIVGTFAGLPQGATVVLNGKKYAISYTGGDGNDVVLTTPALVGVPQFAAGSDVGGGSATLFNPDGSVRFAVTPFAGFTGGVRTVAADFNGDGVADLIVGTGPGIATRVVILDGKTQAVLFDVAPFEATFTGGVYVSAGDVNGDGIPDLAITPDQGGGPRADVYSGATGFPKIASFFGIDDTNFRGGARSAIADMTGDGVADLIVVAGFGGGPRVAAFDGKSLSTGTPVKIFGDFFAFEQALRNGIFVTAGDINGDGFADLIAGGGPGGGPRVLVLDGKSLLSNQYVNLANFFGGDVNSRGGIRVAVKNLDGDTKADLVVGSGTGAGSRVTGYLGKNIAASGTPTTQFDFDSISGFTGGVFVG